MIEEKEVTDNQEKVDDSKELEKEVQEDKSSNKKEEKKNVKISELQKKINELSTQNDELSKNNKDLKLKVDEINDKYLRLAAEYDNYRKRSTREKENTYNTAYGEALNEFLPMIDNLERALKAGENGNVIDGIKLIFVQFEQMLKKLGIEAYGEVGEQFDPNIHNAVLHVEDENLEENVIAEVLMKGYKRGDKVLRFAMVKVAN